LADGGGGQVDEQLCEIELRIDIVSAAGAGQAGKDGCGSSTARIAHKERVLSVQNDAFHLPFADIVIDWYCAIGTEDVQFIPLAQSKVDRLSQYDLAGNVHSYTDGFGTTITENYDAAGRPSIVTSSRVDGTHPGTLFDASSSTAYGPAGLLTAILGNNATVSHGYDNRMRMTASQITNVNGQLLYNLGLTFNPNSTINTGNDSVNGNWSYQYDEFNRLVTASSSAGLGCGFAYDQYGNRWQQDPLNGACTSFIATYNNPLNRIDGYCYDGVGQLLDQGGCAPSGGKNQNFLRRMRKSRIGDIQ
jgi:YD repeat-containing protein